MRANTTRSTRTRWQSPTTTAAQSPRDWRRCQPRRDRHGRLRSQPRRAPCWRHRPLTMRIADALQVTRITGPLLRACARTLRARPTAPWSKRLRAPQAGCLSHRRSACMTQMTQRDGSDVEGAVARACMYARVECLSWGMRHCASCVIPAGTHHRAVPPRFPRTHPNRSRTAVMRR